MRPWLFCLGMGLVLLTGTPAHPQSSSSRRTLSTASETIGGKTLKEWIREMSSRDPSVRQQAIQTVGTGVFQERTGEAGPAVIKALLNQQDSSCRVYAALTLAAMASNKRMGLHEEDVPQAVKALGEGLSYDGQAVVRFHSAIALGMFGDKARMAIPSLVGRVHDPSSWEIRRAVIAALGNVGAARIRGPSVLLPTSC